MEKRRRIGAYGVARDEYGRYLLVRSSSKSNHPGRWVLPGGGLEHGEEPDTGLIREFHEETGLEIVPTGLRDVFSDLVDFTWRGVLLHHDRIVFDVTVTGGRLIAESDGTTDLPSWVSEADLPTLDLNPFTARVLGVPLPRQAETGSAVPVVADEQGEIAVTGYRIGMVNRVTRFAAYGVVRDVAGRVLLSLIADGYPGGGSWHLPGGGIDFGEQPAAGLLREIYEESGQIGEVTGLVRVGSRHNPAAMGPEGQPLDWYTVWAVFTVVVAEPTEAVVTEAAGGSTAEARWFRETQLRDLPLSEHAKRELLHAGLLADRVDFLAD